MEIKSNILEEYKIKIEEANGVKMIFVYNKDGKYIGTLKDFEMYVEKYGLSQIQTYNDNKVCSIGFNEKEQKWYGWSHRAIFGFGIGSIVEAGSCCASSGWTDEYLQEHPDENLSLPVGFKAETLEDAKRMAIAFADSVAQKGFNMTILKIILCCTIGAIINNYIPANWQYVWGFIVAMITFLSSNDQKGISYEKIIN